MDELNELENSKNLSAIKIRKAYMDFLSKEVKEIDEKLKDESLSEEERKNLEEQKKTFEEAVNTLFNLKTPTDEEIEGIKVMLSNLLAKKYDDKKLRVEIEELENEISSLKATKKSQEEEIKKLEEAAKQAQELHEFQKYLFRRSSFFQKEEAAENTKIQEMIAKLSETYPEDCAVDKLPTADEGLDRLKNQQFAINNKIENLQKDGKDTKDLEAVCHNISLFIDRVEEDRKTRIICQKYSSAELTSKIEELKKEVENLEKDVMQSKAMLIVNKDEETKKLHEENLELLGQKKAKLSDLLNEKTFKDFQAKNKNLVLSDLNFDVYMKSEQEKLKNLQYADEIIKREKELKDLENYHKYLYGHDFAKEHQELLDKAAKLKEEHKLTEEKLKNANDKAEPLRKEMDYITNSKKAIGNYESAKDKLDLIKDLEAKAIKNFNGKEFTSEDIKKFLEEQEEFEILADDPNKENIIAALITEITNACKKQKISNVRKDWKTYAKSAGLVAAGIATGLVLSSVPGVGTVRMIFAGAKLAGNVIDKGINIYNSKHKDKEPIRTISKVIKAEAKKILPEKIQSGLKKIDEKLKYKNNNLFLNGVSAGYIAGNVVEMVTGKTVFQNVVDKFNSPQPIIAESNASSLASSSSSSSSDLESAKVLDVDIPTDVITSLNVGNVYDLSNIPDGYVYSGSNNAVKLLTQAGKAVTLDKKVTVNGKVWCSFLQPDGKGYAWIPEDVVKSLGKVANEVGKGLGR